MGASHGKFILNFVYYTCEHLFYERYQLGALKKRTYFEPFV